MVLSPSSTGGSARKIRLLLCTDVDLVSIPVRAAADRAGDMEIVAQAADGISCVTAVRRGDIDIAIIDIGVGERETLTLISRLKRADPDVRVVMVASVSFANIRASTQGLMSGAAGFVPVPTAHSAHASEAAFWEEFARIVRALGPRHGPPRPAARTGALASSTGKPSILTPTEPIKLHLAGGKRPRLLAIGSSTGGPQAVSEVLSAIGAGFPGPILVTQHMPPVFTRVFAANLARKTGADAREAEDGDPLKPGVIYVAPGNRHMRLKRDGGAVAVKLTDEPPINYCRPAVDPMFESAAEVYEGAVLAVVLTGMGQDGLNGAAKVVAAGGTLLAQDQETSIVWGMPGAVAKAGICTAVLPLGEIADGIRKYWQGGKA